MAIPRRAIDLGDDKGPTSQKEDKEAYESTIDKTFQKFADRLAQNPEQVIRYEFKGQPLLYSNSDAVGKLLSPSHSRVVVGSGSGSGGMTGCRNCGAGRTFEVQLTPHAITELEVDETGLEGMDWGTIIVGVCERDCVPAGIATGEAGYLEEWAGVQWEEVGAERK
jgi:pre-rRNA-processing protein TSR4